MSLITTPEYLSKDRLKSELKSHGIKFNHNENKQYYVNLYRKRIMETEQSRYEFSSDEELTRPAKQEKKQQVQRRKKTVKMETYLPDVLSLSDSELKEELESFGKDLGPIIESTRDLYQRMLAKLLAENVTGKSGVSRSVQPRDSTEDEDEDEGVGHTESFVGEWSSGDSDSEEETVEERPPPTPISSQTRRRETGVRERPRRTPATKEEVRDPPPSEKPSEKPRVRSYRRTAPKSTSFQGFLVLLLMFTVAFFSYEHYTSSEKDPSLITKGWRKTGCLWNQVKDYVVKSTPADEVELPPQEPRTPIVTPTEAPTPPPTEPPPTEAPPTTLPPAEQPIPAEASPPPQKKAAKKKPATKKPATAKTNKGK